MSRIRISFLSMIIFLFMQQILHGMDLVHDGIALVASGYTLNEYTQLLGSLYNDPFKRSFDWKQFIKYGFYDGRTPPRIHPWIPSYGLALCTLAELYAQYFPKWKFAATIKRIQKKHPLMYQGSKMIMALPMLLFWSRMLFNQGTNMLNYAAHYFIAPLSLYLAGAQWMPTTKKLIDHIFLHRKKRARLFS